MSIFPNYRTELWKIVDTSLPAAEIGAANGIFSEEMSVWGFPTLYLIDTWAFTGIPGDGFQDQEWHNHNYIEIRERFIGRSDIKFMQGLSVDMAKLIDDDSLGFVYLDACHLEECVTEDLKVWYPKLKRGGIMAGHDLINPAFGVKEAVEKFTKDLNITYEIIPDYSPEYASFFFRKA